jgi:hypothetical protein
MIKVQHWKIYAAHYNDESSGIGMELKRMQSAYQNYGGMGIPISGEILSRSKKPNCDDVFPYLYEGTTEEDYKLALSVEKSNCCVTFSEFFTSKHNTGDDAIELMTQELAVDEDQTDSFTCAFTADYVDDATFQTPQKSKQGYLGEGAECVETDMRQCQGNSLFLSPTAQKLQGSIEKATKDTQAVYTTKSLQEARKYIIASDDHILQHDLVRENPLAAEFVSTMEREMQNIK